MNRHWVFGGEQHYASGGMHDLIGRYPSVDAAKAAALEAEQQGRMEWWQIVVASSGVIVAQSEFLPYGGERICPPPRKKIKNRLNGVDAGCRYSKLTPSDARCD